MTYSTAEKNAAATALCKHFLPLHFAVARAWVTCEQGYNNNVFGVVAGGKLITYPTMEAGVAAAAKIIKTLKCYEGLRAAIATGDPVKQAIGFTQCPWHLGPTGLIRAGGTDPYYQRIFRAQGHKV